MTTLKNHLKQLHQAMRPQLAKPQNLAIGLTIALASAWLISAAFTMQRNYELQKQVNLKKQQLRIIQLETETLEIEKAYYKTAEYQELAARNSLGLAYTDEKVIILPKYSEAVLKEQSQKQNLLDTTPKPREVSNPTKWLNFLLGRNRR